MEYGACLSRPLLRSVIMCPLNGPVFIFYLHVLIRKLGDLETAFLGAQSYFEFCFYSGTPLRGLEEKLGIAARQAASLEQELSYKSVISFHQCIDNLLKSSLHQGYEIEDSNTRRNGSVVMKGPIMYESDVEELRKDQGTLVQWSIACRWKLVCAFWVS